MYSGEDMLLKFMAVSMYVDDIVESGVERIRLCIEIIKSDVHLAAEI